jgi:phosphomannomutase/phosphoglucomutase
MADKGKPNDALKTNLPPALISGAIALAAALVLALVLLPGWEKQLKLKQYQLLAQQQANAASLILQQLQQSLQAQASSESVTSLLNSGNTELLNAFSQQMQQGLHGSSSALLLPLDGRGASSLNKLGVELRNNIEKNLLNKVYRDEAVSAEAYRFKGDIEFSLAVPVYHNASARPVGALLVRYPVSVLKTATQGIESDTGATALTQGQLVLLAQAGDNASQAYTSDIPATSWQARFTPSASNQAEQVIPQPIVLAVTLLPALLIPVWHFLTLRRRDTALVSDLETLSTYVANLRQGDNRMPPALNDQRLKALSDEITHLRSKSNKPASRKTPAAAETPSTEPATPAPTPAPAAPAEPRKALKVEVPDHIFRAYDVRGVADTEFTDQTVKALGLAIGSEATARGHDCLVLGYDGRLSSPRIKAGLLAGLKASGLEIIDVGCVPTPVLYFATHELGTGAGIMITGSHNAAQYNGLKLVMEGRPLAGEHIQNIKQRILNNNYTTGEGRIREDNVNLAYIDRIVSDIAVAAPLKIAMDAGNGMAGDLGPRLLEELGCEVIALHCDIDGSFPNHAPDPTRPENLEDLANSVRKSGADLGLAFDGDADRLVVLDSDGELVEPDALLMLLAQDVVSRNPGADIIYDVKCTRHLGNLISSLGGRPIMWMSGHSRIKEKMLETGALLGGEYTGHICFKERWFGFDDGLYAAARLIEIVSMSGLAISDLLQEFPKSVCTPEIIIETGESQKFSFIEMLSEHGDFGEGKVSKLDGVRADFEDGWGLVRASNTGPAITLRFEADDQAALDRIQHLFREQIGIVNPSLSDSF